jgi:2-methylisocitrate lyase-like PEP mutase family enzyme
MVYSGSGMTTQADRATLFAQLHSKGDPLMLFNIWDAGSARALQDAGAKAVATGSWSVAAAHGYPDGEKIPLNLVLSNAQRICDAINLPVTIDFEGGYGRTPEELKEPVQQLISTGAVGINFEDQIIGGSGLYSIEDQSERIRAIRKAAEEVSIPLFINARTDIFLKAERSNHSKDHVKEAIRRAEAYASAGASGFFAPGLRNREFISKLCDRSPLPVNILQFPDMDSPKTLAELGVARISYGPFPYRQMIDWIKDAAGKFGI